MKNTEINQIKGHGMIKKTKAYGAVGAIAFMGVLSMAGNTNEVLAQETEPVMTDETSQSVIQAEVISSELDQSIDKAETTGVNVTEGEAQTYASLEEAQADLDEQTVEMEKAIAEKEADEKNRQAIEKQNAEIDQRNAEAEEYNKQAKEAADAENAKRKAEYDANMEKYEAEMKNYQQKIEAYEKAKQDVNALDESGITEVDMLPSGSWVNFKPIEVTDGVKVFGNGNVGSVNDILGGSYNITVFSEDEIIKKDHIIKSIVWEGGIPEAVIPDNQILITPYDQIQALYEANGGTNQLYNISEGGTTTVCSVVNGIWVRFKNAVTMYDGSKRDLEAQFSYAQDGHVPEIGWGFITLWNANGAINAYNGENYEGGMDDGLTRVFRIAGAEEKEKFLWSTIVYDTDVGQYLYGNFNVLSVGGNQTANQNNVWSIEDPNGSVINPKWGYGVDASGSDSAPDSTSAVVAYNENYTITTRNTAGGLGTGTAVGDFGTASVMPNIVINPPVPTEPSPWKPVEPDFKPMEPHRDVPEPAVVNAKYHKVLIEQTPGNEKSVQDKTGKDINENTVITNSETYWVLGNNSLKAGRDFIKELSMTDELPADFDVDLAKTAAASADYDVTYDAAGRIVTFVAKQAAIETLNADLRSDVEIPLAIIVGHPTKDASSYPNTFTTHLTTLDAVFDVDNPKKAPEQGNKENKIDIPSNKVIIYTPNVETKKRDFNTEGVNINGKAVNPGSVNVYKMSWNLAPYKNASASEDMIQKGFFYIDDYPEEAVTINTDEIQVLTPTGKEVDVTVHQFDSIDQADENIKNLMKKNNISVNGAFQVFEVKNPQQFYDSYVKNGVILTINNPMTVKQEMKNSGKTYKNKAYQIDFGNGYATNEVVNIVPVVKPVKENLNENNTSIDGLTVAPLSINYYKLHWDLDQYKGMKEVKDAIERGFFYIDDYPEKAVTVLKDQIKIQDEDGNNVSGIKVSFFDSVASASKQVQQMIKSNGFFIEGAFQLFEAENPSDFYEKYVSTGKNIIITNPMQVKEDMVGKYENSSYQIDFGNIGYPSNITVNNVVVPVPVKVNENEEGININGKSILPGGLNFYELTWDLDQYKDMQADKDSIQKGFYFMDDYPEDVLEIVKDAITILDAKGDKVEGISYEILSDSSSLPGGLHPKGSYLLFKADNPAAFFEKYVKTGTNIKITAPMKVKKNLNNIDYENTAYQIDFGNAVQTETIINHVPGMDVKKDVVVDMSDESLDGKVIELGKVFSYKLTGALIPKEHSETLWQYLFKDDYDESHDEYLGKYTMTALTDILLNDGTIIKEGTDLTEYTTQMSDAGIVSISFMKDFLEKISLDSAFQAEALIQMKRIASGEVQNTFTNVVNDAEVISNTVVTYTPEIPVKGVNTAVGFNTGIWSSLAGMAALGLGLLRRKRS